MGLYIKEEMFVSSSSKFLIFLPDDLPIYNSSYVDIESQSNITIWKLEFPSYLKTKK